MGLLTPYLTWIKLAGVAAILVAAFSGGCRMQANLDAAKIAKKETALKAASASLRGAADAIKQVNVEAARRVREAAESDRRAADAGLVAERATVALKERQASFAVELKRARKRAACDALLNTDLGAVCGLQLR